MTNTYAFFQTFVLNILSISMSSLSSSLQTGVTLLMKLQLPFNYYIWNLSNSKIFSFLSTFTNLDFIDFSIKYSEN